MKKCLLLLAMFALVAATAILSLEAHYYLKLLHGRWFDIETRYVLLTETSSMSVKALRGDHKRLPDTQQQRSNAPSRGGFEKGLRVRFDKDDNPSAGKKYFFKIAQSASNARAQGWKLTKRPSITVLPQLVMYCPEDKVLCALYDDTGYIAGLQVALSKSDFSNNVYGWAKRGFTSWNITVDGVYKMFWTLQQYFVSQDFLQKSKEERLASRDSTCLLQERAIWVVGTNKELKRISTSEEEIVQEGLFTKQACITWMGQHYYYNMSSTTECTADQMFPWFLMMKNNTLVATGLLTYGKIEISDGRRDWFEHPGLATVKALIPEGPRCLYDVAAQSGTITMHLYYIDQPWTITC